MVTLRLITIFETPRMTMETLGNTEDYGKIYKDFAECKYNSPCFLHLEQPLLYDSIGDVKGTKNFFSRVSI